MVSPTARRFFWMIEPNRQQLHIAQDGRYGPTVEHGQLCLIPTTHRESQVAPFPKRAACMAAMSFVRIRNFSLRTYRNDHRLPPRRNQLRFSLAVDF